MEIVLIADIIQSVVMLALILNSLKNSSDRPLRNEIANLVEDKNSEHLKNLVYEKTRRLRLLQEQEAKQGMDAPLKIKIEIEDIKQDIKKLTVQIKGLYKKGGEFPQFGSKKT